MEPKRVLFIDDDLILHFIMKEQVTQASCDVDLQVAKNGLEGLNHLNECMKDGTDKQFPHAILVDINMPVMGGWEFLQHFSDLFGTMEDKCNVYLFSSNPEMDLAKLDDGNSIFGIPIQLIEKPITQELLNSILAATCASERMKVRPDQLWSAKR